MNALRLSHRDHFHPVLDVGGFRVVGASFYKYRLNQNVFKGANVDNQTRECFAGEGIIERFKNAIVTRVELGRENTQIVLDAAVLFADRHHRVGFSELISRLAPSEQAVWEEGGERAAIRSVLPARMQLRGGRTWLDGGREIPAVNQANRGLVTALRASHAELMHLNASPLTAPAAFAGAKAPDGLHRRQLSRLPFLAPDLQQAILDGRQPAALKLRTLLKSELPLLWSEQRAWFGRLRAKAF